MYESSPESQLIQKKLIDFMEQEIYPRQTEYRDQLASSANRFSTLPIVEELKAKARKLGLWNLFVQPHHSEYCDHPGLSNFDYAPLAEQMGRVMWCPEVFNCNAPDTGNMEVLMNFATDEQKERWLGPLLAGEIRSSYAMTEPQVASSDATNIELEFRKSGEAWILNGRKWFITGAMNDRCAVFIVMGKSDPENPDRHKQQTQALVPRDSKGLRVVRPLTTLGYDDAPMGHAELVFEDVRVSEENLLLGPGRGFEIAQSRLGPGRMHHCMRLVGAAQQALELACERVSKRQTFGRLLAKHQSIREGIAKSFSEIEMMRLLILKTCRQMDDLGVEASLDMIASTKSTVPRMAQGVIDRCMQMHGAAGLTADFPMAEAFNYARWCRQADGPDQVHQMSLGKMIIDRFGNQEGGHHGK